MLRTSSYAVTYKGGWPANALKVLFLDSFSNVLRRIELEDVDEPLNG